MPRLREIKDWKAQVTVVQMDRAHGLWSEGRGFESTQGEKKSNPYRLIVIQWITIGLSCGITGRNPCALLLIDCIRNGLNYWMTQSQITLILSDYKWINNFL
jgi:hypothetical protein